MSERTIDLIRRKPMPIRKRKHDEIEPAGDGHDLEETQIVKIAKTTESPQISTSLSLESEVVLPSPSACSSACNHLHHHPQFEISMASMRSVRDHLSDITAKNASIKATMHDMRESAVNELLSHLRVRSIAIGQIGRTDLEEEMRDLCLGVLEKKKDYMNEKENELLMLEKLLGGHDTMLELVNSALQELEMTIETQLDFITLGGDWVPLRTALPHMTRLAEYTNSYEEHKNILQKLSRGNLSQTENSPLPEGDFIRFSRLPPEIRCYIWQEALPKPRILTHNAHHNRYLILLSTCHESRILAQSQYSRVLSPTATFPLGAMPFIYTNLNSDTVIRDLTIRDVPPHNLFALTNITFTTTCHLLLNGLSQIKHIALAYDILRENGGTLFRSVQVCCPQLKTLTIFPASQLRSSTRHSNQNLKFIEIDSNLIDYTCFRLDRLSDRKMRTKALRGLAVVAMLFSHSLQYKTVFREYVDSYGKDWNPIIKVCLLARWNRRMGGWQMRSLAGLGDRCSRGFEGDDGRTYKGFMEAGMVCGEDGEGLSRYDGVRQLLKEEEGNFLF